jgi:peroxiredoxin
MKRFFAVSIIILSVCSIHSAYSGAKRAPDHSAAGDAKAAPDFSIPDLAGKTITLSDFKGKVVILDFWDTWCPPCRKEIPDFVTLYNENKDKGLVIIGLAFGREGKDKVVQFSKDKEITYPVVIATDKVVEDFGPFDGIPTTFIIDKKGNIIEHISDEDGKPADRYVGFTEKSEFEKVIAPLLK